MVFNLIAYQNLKKKNESKNLSFHKKKYSNIQLQLFLILSKSYK